MTQEMPGYVRGTVEYTVTTAFWDTASDLSMARAVRSVPAPAAERIHDLQTSVEATIPQTATRVYGEISRQHSVLERRRPMATRARAPTRGSTSA